MANTNKLWKGAVEPAELSPSGNEYRAAKGAVEPTEGGYSLPSSADRLVGGITRGVTRGITRGVTEDWTWS